MTPWLNADRTAISSTRKQEVRNTIRLSHLLMKTTTRQNAYDPTVQINSASEDFPLPSVFDVVLLIALDASIRNEHAASLINLLELPGFPINREKS